MWWLSKTTSLLTILIGFVVLSSCRPESANAVSRVQWGIHQSGRYANLLNLMPGQSVAVCAPSDEWTKNAHEAIKQWSSAIGRWGYFEVKPCDQRADLRINMQGFGQTGLNYFTDRPGRIYIDSESYGSYNRAIILHEFGHSFGLCDQYMDAGNANCSDARSPRQNNDDVMGVTTSRKTRLTAGDIEGVKKAASDLSIRANVAWQDFLAKQNSQADGIFASLAESIDDINPKLAISVTSGSIPYLCINKANLTSCAKGSSDEIVLEKWRTTNDRDIFISQKSIGTQLSSGNTEFVVSSERQGINQSTKFVIKKR